MLGIHGTSISISERIKEEGFKLSSTGRLGSGVYFWRYFDNNSYAKYLAYKWWEYSCKCGNYNNHGSNTDCCLITIELDVINNILDLTHGVLRENIRSLVNTELKRIKINETNGKSELTLISGLYSVYVDHIEKHTGTPVDAIISDISTPKGTPGKIGQYFGNCGEALIVLNMDCINVIKYELVNEYEY